MGFHDGLFSCLAFCVHNVHETVGAVNQMLPVLHFGEVVLFQERHYFREVWVEMLIASQILQFVYYHSLMYFINIYLLLFLKILLVRQDFLVYLWGRSGIGHREEHYLKFPFIQQGDNLVFRYYVLTRVLLPSLDIQVSGISYRLFLMPFLYVPLSVTCPLRSFST